MVEDIGFRRAGAGSDGRCGRGPTETQAVLKDGPNLPGHRSGGICDTDPEENHHARAHQAAVLIGGALLAAVTAVPAEAAPRPLIDLRGADVGSFVVDDAGAARLTGRVTGRPFDGTYTAVLTADDASLPEPGRCEPATATLKVTGPKKRYLRLAATGEVCGTWPDATYVVTHQFVGRYQVTHSSARRLRGTDGWISQILATEGRANVEAIDT